jgi:formylglycine-generating enzyme required for sulfatase activity
MVRVSYEDAVAYCEWLTERERAAGRLPEGYRYRLPDGDEWTRYAQCGTNRQYPWGDSMPPTRGNYSGAEARRGLRKRLGCYKQLP